MRLSKASGESLSLTRIVRFARRLPNRALNAGRGMLRVAAAPREAVSTVLSPTVRRAFPAYRRKKLVYLVADVIVVLVAATLMPVLLLPLAVVVGVAAFRVWWRARKNWGHGRGLPPGKVGVGSRAFSDADYFFAAAERYGPLFKTNHFGEPMFCVVGVAEAAALLGEHKQSLGTVPRSYNRHVPGSVIRWMEPGPVHDEYRRLFGAAFGARVIRANEELFSREIDQAFQRMARASDGSGVHPFRYVRDLVMSTWIQTFLSISPASEHSQTVEHLLRRITYGARGSVHLVEEALESLEELLSAQVAENGAGTSGSALAAILERQPSALGNQATMRNLIFNLDTTRDDVGGLVMWVLKHACDNPHYLARLREEPPVHDGRDDPKSLANRMVSETIRLEQSEHLFRRARRDVEFEGYLIPANWLVRVCTHESHRDPRIFPQPNVFDPDRFLHVRGAKDGYAPFGMDGRSCLGEPLTRRFASTFVSVLARDYDVQVTDDGPREMGFFQHWAPNTRFRVHLAPRR